MNTKELYKQFNNKVIDEHKLGNIKIKAIQINKPCRPPWEHRPCKKGTSERGHETPNTKTRWLHWSYKLMQLSWERLCIQQLLPGFSILSKFFFLYTIVYKSGTKIPAHLFILEIAKLSAHSTLIVAGDTLSPTEEFAQISTDPPGLTLMSSSLFHHDVDICGF